MNRKDFLKKAALATFVLSTSSFLNVFSREEPAIHFLKRNLSEADLEPVSAALQTKINDLFNWMNKAGWISYIKGLNLGFTDDHEIAKMIAGIDADKLFSLKSRYGFEDFGGNKFIEPGYPSLSLLYHILANPRVSAAVIADNNYPGLEQIDLLEDYIYALKKWDSYKTDYKIKGDDELVLAVFAYEYRTAFKTPHHICADLVFSRTGVGRIGNKDGLYNKKNRCYTNNPSGNDDDKNIAVIPARYGLFIAKKGKRLDQNDVPDMSVMNMGKDKQNDKYYTHDCDDLDYLIPVRKLFNDDLLINSAAVSFTEKHINVKISKVTDQSYRRDSKSLVTSTSVNSSFLISSKPAGLVQAITDNKTNQLLKFTVPAGEDSRYFTTYYNGGNSPEVENIEIYDSTYRTREENPYHNPRILPMYINLSHKIVDNTVVYRGRFANTDFEKEINSQLQDIPLFQDNICDGMVSASVAMAETNMLFTLHKKGVLNAFSIITAPDFLPQVDDFDLERFDIAPGTGQRSLFLEGGIASLSSCTVPPNPIVNDSLPQPLRSFDPDKTYTAVVSGFRKGAASSDFENPERDKGYIFSSYLPDMCSSIFAPGWDVTYSANSDDKKDPIYLSTQGLGAPFVEDMKLCAAMNGMWPAASPDASRTYQGSVTKEEYDDAKKEWLRNPTAIPLLDDEIGFNKNSPAVVDQLKQESMGWDGEQGPFLEFLNTKCYINFTDLGRADYVENARLNTFDMSQLRKLDSREVNFRMNCFKLCLQVLGQNYFPNGNDDLWLVSAEKADWKNVVTGFGVPKSLLTGDRKWAINPQRGITGDGFLYVFASFTPDLNANAKSWVADGDHTKRRRIACNTIYVCQVSAKQINHYKLDCKSTNIYDPSNWQ